jgi:hypothetical protein
LNKKRLCGYRGDEKIGYDKVIEILVFSSLSRKKKNRIKGLIDDNGNYVEGDDNLSPLVMEYF